MNREQLVLIALAVTIVGAGALFVIAAVDGNVVRIVVWGLVTVVWAIQAWLRLRALRADPRT